MQEFKPVKEGKVREIYDNGDNMIIVATDRISAFDDILKNKITDKGAVLTQMSKFWFDYTKDVVPNHMVSTDVKDMPEFFQQPLADDLLPDCTPPGVHIVPDAPPQCFDLAGVVGLQNLLCNFGILKLQGFLVHHVLFHVGKGNAVFLERRGIPVAEIAVFFFWIVKTNDMPHMHLL